MKPGGTEGGTSLFLLGGGLILAAAGLYFLFHSIHVISGEAGAISGSLGGRGRGGLRETTSMGVVFVPFLIGLGVLFYDAGKKWAWWLSSIGLAIIVIEVLSRVRFRMDVKLATLLLILGMIAAGAGMVAKAYRHGARLPDSQPPSGKDDPEDS